MKKLTLGREPLIGLLAVLLPLAGTSAAAKPPAVSPSALSTAEGSKPNIVLILADDMGYADIGVHGCEDIPTPNIDQICNEGVRFTAAYANGSFCTPTRVALMSGCSLDTNDG